MNKTVTVNLNGIIFTLDEDAHERLAGYLDSIKKHFGENGDAEEILRDIESSIAEKFSRKVSDKKQVITKADVENLIKVMGSVTDIAQEDNRTADYTDLNSDSADREKDSKGEVKSDFVGEQSNKSRSEKIDYKTGKKLFRDTEDVVFAGVCSGLAAFFGIDPVIVRLVFAISIFFGGAGIIAYIVLWIAMPEAKTSAQKLEMKGQTVTLEHIEKAAKAKSSKLKEMDTSGARKVLSAPFRFIGELFRVLGRFLKTFGFVILGFIGVVLIISAVFSIAGAGIFSANMLFNYNSPYFDIDIPVREIVGSPMYSLGIISGFFTAVIPIIFLLLLGAAMVSRKKTFNAATNSILIVLWMIAVITFGVIAIDAAPRIESEVNEYVESVTITKEYNLQDFKRIDIGAAHSITVTSGDEYSIIATGPAKSFERLEIEVEEGTLEIGDKARTGICFFCFNIKGIDFSVAAPELIGLEGSGASQINADGFNGEDIDVKLSGASKGDVDLKYRNYDLDLSGASKLELNTATSSLVKAEISGASNLDIWGIAEELDIDISGASKVGAYNLTVEKAEIEASGASKAWVNASEQLDIDASGASKIYYQGDASVISDTSGGSEVIKE